MIEKKSFWDRITKAFNTDEVQKIANKTGYKYQSVRRWKKEELPTIESLKLISDLTNRSIHWLLTGEGEEYVSKNTIERQKSLQYKNLESDSIAVHLEEHVKAHLEKLAKEEKETVRDIAERLIIESLISRGIITDQVEGMQLQFFGDYEIKLVPIPLLGIIAAGQPIQVFDVEETVLVAEEFVIPGRETYGLRVQGDSMADQGILDNDLIIVIRANFASPGQTVVALIDGDKATVKKFYRKGKQIVLRPANPLHKDIVVDSHRVEIQGIVIGLQRRT